MVCVDQKPNPDDKKIMSFDNQILRSGTNHPSNRIFQRSSNMFMQLS